MSACLLGEPVRYDGRRRAERVPVLQRWRAEGRVVVVCPEVAGGLDVPRPMAELVRLGTRTRVLTAQGGDVTDAFERGAQHALSLAREHEVLFAVLKQRSPSCGTEQVYDGTFSGRLVDGQGTAAGVLRAAGFRVFGEDRIDEAEQLMARHLGEGNSGSS